MTGDLLHVYKHAVWTTKCYCMRLVMLYLEDFLELIDHLPAENRKRFTEMRALDEAHREGTKSLNQMKSEIFERWQFMSSEERLHSRTAILEQYDRLDAISDRKIAIADGLYNLIEKYSKKMNKEIMRFKYELEADNPGVTEKIEKRFIEAERAAHLQRKERRKRARDIQGNLSAINGDEDIESTSRIDVNANSIRDSDPTGSNANRGRSSHRMQDDGVIESRITGLLESVGREVFEMQKKKNWAISVNASSSPALISQSQASMEEASGSSSIVETPMINRFLDSPLPKPSAVTFAPFLTATSNTAAVNQPGPSMLSFSGLESRHGRPRKLTPRAQEMIKETIQRQERRFPSYVLETDEGPDGDESDHDTDKRTWCVCNQRSYGCMVACDSEHCPFEWFHIACVGLSQVPKGKWFCPQCSRNDDGSNCRSIN